MTAAYGGHQMVNHLYPTFSILSITLCHGHT